MVLPVTDTVIINVSQKQKHECEDCDKTFHSSFNLKRHRDSLHSGKQKVYTKHIKKDGKYICRLCGQSYTRTNKLKNHYIRKHQLEDMSTVGVTEQELKLKRKSTKP
jgi:uncharacterized Zn-finger protein